MTDEFCGGADLDQQQAVQGLAKFLSVTPQYRELKSAVEELKKNPEAFRKLREFRAEVGRAQSTPEQMERLRAEHQRLSQILEIARYFQAGDSYDQVLGGVLGEVNMMLEQALGM